MTKNGIYGDPTHLRPPSHGIPTNIGVNLVAGNTVTNMAGDAP